MSKQLQKEFGMGAYRWPILAGVGAGGTVAYGAAAQAPDGTIAGALVLDPAATLQTRIPLCAGAPARPAGKDGFSYGAFADMPGWLRLAEHNGHDAMPWLRQIKGARKITVDADKAASEVLTVLLEPEVGSRAPGADELPDLPLVELPDASKPRALAEILSGDGGWRDLDMQIGQVLARKDIGVVGWDTLRYFWQAKSPERIAADLDRVIGHYQAAWGVQDVLLVGYSLGADVLPAAIDEMDPGIRDQVVQISLLGLARQVAFEFHVAGNWLGLDNGSAAPIAPDAKRLDMARVQCVYGEEETDSLCPDPLFAKAELIKTRGGHHFDGDYQALARHIIDGFDRRRAA
jgi:type IV secretory pathway VirJ component